MAAKKYIMALKFAEFSLFIFTKQDKHLGKVFTKSVAII